MRRERQILVIGILEDAEKEETSGYVKLEREKESFVENICHDDRKEEED